MARNYTFKNQPSSNSSTRSHYGYGSKPTGITIHHWGSTGQKFENVVAWLRGAKGGTSNKGTSAHYVVEAGRVSQLVGDSRAAWHAGSTPGNGSTIGIECRPEMSDGDWATLVQLCADIEEEHGSMKYYGHKDWKNTACPGDYYPNLGKLVKDVNAEHAARKKGGTTSPKPSKPAPSKPSKPRPTGKAPKFPLASGHWYGPESSNSKNHSGYYSKDRAGIKQFQSKLKSRGWTISADGLFGPSTSKIVKQFQDEKGLKVDGGVGISTWNAIWEEPIT